MAKEVMVYQANPLIEGRRDFSLTEARLFYIGLREVVPRLTNKVKVWGDKAYKDFPTTVIPANELVQMFGNKKYYSTLEEICDKLIKKSVKIKRADGKGYSNYTVFAELSYNVDEGLRLEFSPKMIPFLLDLADKPFTKLPFEQVWALHSPYSIRLFEMLLQYQNTKTHERTLEIEELRFCLGVPDEAYRDRMSNFRRFIVDSCVKDINEKTNFKVEYESVKEGRKIVAFKFKLHLPAEQKKEQRAKQISEIGQMVAVLADKASVTEEKPAISDEQRARNQRNMQKLLETLGK